jgi:hypothetical protein
LAAETYQATQNETAALPRRFLLPIYLLLGVAALLPLALVDLPALVDYPNHLARLHIVANIGADEALAANYQVIWAAMPNLAMDIVSWPFLGLLPVETLGLLFTLLTMAVLVVGTLALHRALHGSIGLWPAAAWLSVRGLDCQRRATGLDSPSPVSRGPDRALFRPSVRAGGLWDLRRGL